MSVPGLVQPTVSSMNGPTPQAAAAAEGASSSQKLALMNSKLAGGRRKKWRGGKGDVAVPQFQMAYTPQNGPSQDPNTQIKDLSAASTQASANSVYDNQATKMGGRRKKRGGNPDWNWGCKSGGRRTRRRTRKTRKNRRSRRHRKSRH